MTNIKRDYAYPAEPPDLQDFEAHRSLSSSASDRLSAS